MPIITLTTDFGLADPYVGAIKGVILRIVPSATLIDLTHQIAPQNVRHAAYLLGRVVPYYPHGTVHLVVVDPGVGSLRRPLAVATEEAYFVGPDNGVLSYALCNPSAQAFALDRPEYWLPEPSNTFHARDIFAPVAAHLAQGVSIAELGSPVSESVCLPLPEPHRISDTHLQGEVVYVDVFGNLITNLPGDWLSGREWAIRTGDATIIGIQRAYADVAEGAPLALVSSAGTLEIAVRDGSAARHFGLGPHAIVDARTTTSTP